MHFLYTVLYFTCTAVASKCKPQSPEYVDWRTFKATGVNLGGWLLQESTIDTAFWTAFAGNLTDEWSVCELYPAHCASMLEDRYANYINRSTIDVLASAGINLIRIPTTYSAWVEIPGSKLYTGSQVEHLRRISNYAIRTYGMHVVIDVHSLPGGINGLDIGEAVGHLDWFYNETNLDYSYQTIAAVLDFVQSSGHPGSFSIAPINEPSDTDFSNFGTPGALSEEGAGWLLRYVRGVLDMVKAINGRIPVMFQGSFKPETYWSGNFTGSENMVLDVHKYFFADPEASPDKLPGLLCDAAQDAVGDGKIPVFLGEWAIQTLNNNTLASRKTNLNAGLYAYHKYLHGSAYWTARYYGTAGVGGEGTQEDYWNFESFINMGLVDMESGAGFC